MKQMNSYKKYSHRIGTAHPIQDLIQRVRMGFIDIGFDEIENPVFISEDDVYKQYGPEAPVVLDRCYYLAGLPRPDIGLGKDKIDKIREIAGIDIEKFKGILREYREGSVSGDDLSEEIVCRLNIQSDEAIKIIELFGEFKTVTAVPTKMTLRSHMTAAWFPTIQAMQNKHKLPLRLFSIGLRFRREQKLSPTHLRAHYGASCVITGGINNKDEKIDLESGKEISRMLLDKLDFGDIEFIKKKATSNYYESGTEFEIFSGGIEVADCGMYSQVALSNYGIKFPVFNLGFGLERVLMVKEGYSDVRELLYPQFYEDIELSDEEIKGQIRINKKPETDSGMELAEKIAEVARKHSDEKSPCRFNVYEGEFMGKNIKVDLVEEEENTKLLGPAALNEIYVHEGSIYGIPEDPGRLNEKLIDVKKKGVYAGFSYLDAIANLFAAKIEKLITGNEDRGLGETLAHVDLHESGGGGKSPMSIPPVKMAKTPADVNIFIGDSARAYITSKNKKIQIKGPIFISVSVEAK